MKLNLLTIHNIASIEDATIDFASPALAGQDLFLICGPTGSGKSTILDAICLALFNMTPRIQHSAKDSIDLLAEDENKKKETLQDVLHLVRKNAPEASVSLRFEGADGKMCTALWSVKRKISKKGNVDAQRYENETLEQKLRREAVREWTLTDGEGIVYDKPTDVRAAIERIIGMDFEQFCKTTMLAQGEFTKFLASTSDEKAKILEKLVGTEKYAEVGAIINRMTNDKNNEVIVMRKELENIHFLTDEQLQQLQQQITSLQAQNQALSQQRESMVQRLNLLIERDKVMRELAEATQALQQARDNMTTDQVKVIAAQVELWFKTVDVRVAVKQQKEAQSQVAHQTQSMQQLLREREQLPTLSEPEQQLQALGADTIDDEATALSQRQALVTRTLDRLQSWEKAHHDYQQRQKELTETESKRTELEKRATETKEALTLAEQQHKTAEDAYNHMKAAVEDHARVLRAELKQGDTCPVCGKVIDEVLSDERFIAMLAPLKQAYDDTRNAVNLATKNDNEAQTNVKAMLRTLPQLQKSLTDAQQTESSVKAEVQTYCQQLQVPVDKALRQQLTAWEVDNNTQLQQITTRRQQIKIIRQGQQQWNEWHRQEQILKSQMDQTGAQIQQAELAIQEFLSTHADIQMTDIQAVSIYSLEQIQQQQQYIERLKNQLLLAEKRMSDATQKVNNLPIIELGEGETAETIRQQQTEMDAQITANNQEIGRIQSELESDKINHQTQGEKKQQLDQLIAEWAEWSTLDNYLGSTQGKRFRNVAQSFILGDLLNKANAYLENITGRYTLFCNPGTLTIMMRDAYQGGVVRPTNTLSGGESFIISLALALGLSSMQSSGFEVDTLFIDEGFGTLSPEYLDPVITSLKRLYELYGRRVGIISHVETLRARIPVTIEITREGHSSSRVQITDNR